MVLGRMVLWTRMPANARSAPRPTLALISRIAFALGIITIVALAIEQVVRIGDFRVDDTYITFSFSKNLAAGNGPVYSHGLKVEGYSNFLWMLLITPAFWISPETDGYAWGRGLGFLLLAFGCFLTYRIARRGAGPLTSLLAPFLFLVCSDVVRATLSALETIPYTVAIVFGWWVYLHEPPSRRRWSLLAFLPAALMRIDGFVPVLIVVGFEVLHALSERRFSWRALARWAAPTVLIWSAYFAWRYAYYGLPLPTTYYAKTAVTLNEPHRGYNQIWSFVREYGVAALLPFMGLPLVRGPERAAAALWTTVVLYLVFAGMTGGDWMPFNRFLLPVVPLGAILTTWGAARFLSDTQRFPVLLRAGAQGLLIAALAFFCVRAHMASVDTPEERVKLGEASHVMNHTTNNLLKGMDLARYIIRQPGDRLVSDYAGVFALFTDALVIDMWGLCSAEIALKGVATGINPVFGKTCVSCYAELAPDYFHANVPLVRSKGAFRSVSQVVDHVFQGDEIDRVIGLRKNFAAGRVVEARTGRALWFLERRRSGIPLVSREPASGIRVDYPFE
jgi:hypothetical protein